MRTSDLLSEHSVLSSLRVSGKDHAFEQIARAIGSLHGLDAKRIFQALREREQLGFDLELQHRVQLGAIDLAVRFAHP